MASGREPGFPLAREWQACLREWRAANSISPPGREGAGGEALGDFGGLDWWCGEEEGIGPGPLACLADDLDAGVLLFALEGELGAG